MKKLESGSLRSVNHPEHKDISRIIEESEARVRKFVEDREKEKASNRREANRERESRGI